MTTPDDNPGVLGRILGWLEAGYPEGVPRTDRFALVALLKRRLTDDEVREIARRLTVDVSFDEAITPEEIEELIGHVLADEPSPDDIGRVSARLAAGGWPLAGAENDEPGSAHVSETTENTERRKLQETAP